MITNRLSSADRRHDTRAGGLFAWIFLALFSVSAWAGGSNGNSSSVDNPTNASSPGEEVTSLPMIDATSGLTLVGTVRELRALVLGYQGLGQVVVQRLDARRFAVTFFGEYRVEFDRARLASGAVAVLFRGGPRFSGGTATLRIGDSAPMTLDPERVPLPIARLAAVSRAHGQLLSLRVVGSGIERALLGADFRAGRVIVTQLMR